MAAKNNVPRNQAYWDGRGPNVVRDWYNKSEKELQKFLDTYDIYLKELDINMADLLRRGGDIESLPVSKVYKSFLATTKAILQQMSKEEYNYLHKNLYKGIQGVIADTNDALGISFDLPNDELLDLLREPWVDGKNFSDRIWHNKSDLVRGLDRKSVV